MVHSMTPLERDDVAVIDRSRSRRIAAGSGTQPHEVSRLAEQFRMMSRMTQQMAKMGPGAMGKAMAGMGGMPGMPGMPGLPTKGSTRTESVKARFKKRR
jgi:signal recognition particle subunit SRP54